jgi:hypothetical protein
VSVLHFPDSLGLADLATLVRRARAVAPDGAVRLQTRGRTLGVWVEVLGGSGLFAEGAALGVRGLELARPPEDGALDAVVATASLADRFARDGHGAVTLALPPARAHAAWAGATGALSGWSEVGLVPANDLLSAARAGVEEIAGGAPAAAGSHAVQALRARVWGRRLDGDVPAGAAFAAYALGFARPGDQAVVRRSGRWVRLTLRGGHVVAR